MRVDSGVEAGDSVTPFYDSMIAKLIAYDVSREAAFDQLGDALCRTVVIGPKTNLAFLSALIASPEVRAGAHDTGFIDAHLSELGASPREPERAATLAAAEVFWRERAAGQGVASLDPWDVRDSFELSQTRRTPLEVKVDGHVEKLVAEAKGRRDADEIC